MWDEVSVYVRAPGFARCRTWSRSSLRCQEATGREALPTREDSVAAWWVWASCGRSGPGWWTVLSKGGKVDLVVSSGGRSAKRLLLHPDRLPPARCRPGRPCRGPGRCRRVREQPRRRLRPLRGEPGWDRPHPVDERPAWTTTSRSRRRTASTSCSRRRGRGICGINADGSGRRSLPECSTTPGGWSPDSRHFVCSSTTRGSRSSTPWTEPARGSSTAGTAGRSPESPDNDRHVDDDRLSRGPRRGWSKARRRLGIRKVTDSAAPAWSPDSQRVAYVAPGSGFDACSLTIRGGGSSWIAQKIQRTLPSGAGWVADRLVKRLRTTSRPSSRPGDGADPPGERQPRGLNPRTSLWSGSDGRLVLFSRGRFREADQVDIYAVGPVGHGGRALTHPFPSGGTNSTPQWLTGPRVTGHEPSPRTIAFPFSGGSCSRPDRQRHHRRRRAILLLAAEDARLQIWDATIGRSVRGPGALREHVRPRRRLCWPEVGSHRTCPKPGTRITEPAPDVPLDVDTQSLVASSYGSEKAAALAR